VTALRKRMLEDLQRRNYNPDTIRGYVLAVEQFANHFDKSPELMGVEEVGQFQLHLLREKKLFVGTNSPASLLQIQSIDRGNLTVTLAAGGPAISLKKHPLLRRWDHSAGNLAEGGLQLAAHGAAFIAEDSSDTNWLSLEDGIQISVAAGGLRQFPYLSHGGLLAHSSSHSDR
jgi:hypothetical protein